MKTVFVINEETDKVVGTIQVDQRAKGVTYTEMEKIEGGVVRTTFNFEIKYVVIGCAIACVIVVPYHEIAEELTLAEDIS